MNLLDEKGWLGSLMSQRSGQNEMGGFIKIHDERCILLGKSKKRSWFLYAIYKLLRH